MPALYQIVHCRRNRPRLVEEHLALLGRGAQALWGVRPTLQAESIAAAIEALLQREHYTTAVSAFVRINLTSDGAVTLTAEESSLYDGYALRSLHPDACTLHYELPFAQPATTAGEACHALAEEMARSRGYEAAVRCNQAGVCLAMGEAPLFAIGNGELFTSEEPYTVEAKVVALAAERLRMRLHIHPLHRTELHRYEELFAVDHRGLTALAHCDERPFMTLRAERLARAMEQLVSAR